MPINPSHLITGGLLVLTAAHDIRTHIKAKKNHQAHVNEQARLHAEILYLYNVLYTNSVPVSEFDLVAINNIRNA